LGFWLRFGCFLFLYVLILCLQSAGVELLNVVTPAVNLSTLNTVVIMLAALFLLIWVETRGSNLPLHEGARQDG
jgi:hypothetical protein